MMFGKYIPLIKKLLDLCNIKMILKKNKSCLLYSEYVLVIVSLVITGIVLFFVNNMIGIVQTNYKTTIPQLNYEYPLIVVHSFLEIPLKKEDKKLFENYSNINFVKDLFWINSQKSKKILELYKKEYIEDLTSSQNTKNSNSLELFNKFSKSNILKEDLLFFDFDISKNNLENINEIITKTNSLIPIKTQSGTLNLIYFRNGI